MFSVNVVEPLPRDRWSSALANSRANAGLELNHHRGGQAVSVQQPGSSAMQHQVAAAAAPVPPVIGNGSRTRHTNESDYEEIGPPMLPKTSSSSQPTNGSSSSTGEICDLCGTAVAIVKCAACSEQIFCLACDDMYHRHPKRTTHGRKALNNSSSQPSQPIRPPLPPKGDAVATPVAPPRKNLRKGSAPDSPVTPHQSHLATRSSTLPRKAGSMVGRPLPPPPAAAAPPVVKEANPPPALPAKNVNPAPPVPPPQLSHHHNFYPHDNNILQQRKMSSHSQAMHFPQQPDIPLPGYPMPPSHMAGAGNSFTLDNRHHRMMQPTNPMGYPNFNYPTGGGTTDRFNPLDAANQAAWNGNKNPYLEEMQFPTAPGAGMNKAVNNSKRANMHKRNQFVRLNKSSSLHDIAHEEMGMRSTNNDVVNNANGISWMDEPWNTTQSTMNQPTLNMQELLDQQRNFRRASSTKSLHQTNEDLWNSNPWAGSTNPMLNPMLNPMMFMNAPAGLPAGGQPTATGGPVPNALHRSMHELRGGVVGPMNPIRAQSPATSQKSRKSTRSEKFHSRAANTSKASKKHHDKPQSRPHSRNNSQRHYHRKESKMHSHHHRSARESSRSRASSRRRSISSEDEDDDSRHMDSDVEAVINDMSIHLDEDEDSEDFFTGESDNDFVSISSGSNSKRAPRKSWTCEHCTYVNNPGVAVCAVCCRTSKQSRGEEFEGLRSVSRSSLKSKKSKNHHRKYDTSEEDNDSLSRGQRRSVSRQELKSKSERKSKKQPKSPMPEFNVSDLDEDAINDYYAVRHQNNNHGNERYIESSSETGSSMHHNPSKANQVPTRKPNFDAPAPAKGILKKSNSNPQLTKLELDSKTGSASRQPPPPMLGKVVDIKKYLAQTQNNPHLNEANDNNHWSTRGNGNAKSDWNNTAHEDYLSDAESNSSVANNIGNRAHGNMTRSISGHSLGDLEYLQQQYDQQQQGQNGKFHKKASDSGGKKNFRSKRFSRNLEREPAIRRAQSLHMDHRRGFEDASDGFLEMHRGVLRKSSLKPSSSGSSGPEDALHFTATVEGQEVSSAGGATGSYLARQEFGGGQHGEGNAVGDSGYISHSSGGSNTKNSKPMESFTMSVDRGYLGRAPGGGGEREQQQYLHRSMDDLTFQKTKGLELVRLLREAEQSGFTAEDVQVALNHCNEANPVTWLKENWDNMMETVVTLASNVGHEAEENTIGTLSKIEAKEALRKHKGNIWAAVTECVEQRQTKYDQLCAKGNFTREDIVTVLTAHQGNTEAAFQELNKVQLKPFLMRIWGQGDSGEVTSGQAAAAVQNQDLPGSSHKTALTTSAEKPLDDEDDNVPAVANEVTETKHNNKSEPDTTQKKQAVSNADTDRKKNGIAEARENYKFDREVRKFLAEGKISSYEKGEIVVKLMTEQQVSEEEAIVAAGKCDTVEAALQMLQQECQLCMNVMKITEVIHLLNCEHTCCRDCVSKHFTIIIKDRNISEATCPFCLEPKKLAEDDDLAANYFAKLDVLLKPLIEQEVHDLFQRKLRDRTLMKDPNFKWCYKCSSGFIADPRNKKLVCPDCRAMSCAKCLLPWETTHEGLSCEDFAAWKEANDPDNQAKGVEKHLQEHGIQCPNCKFRYALTKGGCMHFTCTQCKFEFCIGCERPFKMGVKCGKGPACAKMGLHAHHPRHCLFYLRDKDPVDLQRLLKTNTIEYAVEVPEEFKHKLVVRCRVQVQKETSEGLVDGLCDEIAPRNYAGYCQVHYTEYLCSLVFRNNVDPVSLLDLGELKQVFARANHFMPKQRPGEYEFQYKKRLAQLVANEIPLDKP